MSSVSAIDLFHCACCERDLPINRQSPLRLENPSGIQRYMCVQCNQFLSDGLPFLVEKIEKKKLKLKKSPTAELYDDDLFDKPKPPKTQEAGNVRKPPTQRAPRKASAIERESFNYRVLTIELYIEGFIKGLEAAGLDRTRLSNEAVTAINNLLNISQTLAGQRMRVNSDSQKRSEIRRLARHVDETALMVDEYVQAVREECATSIHN